MSIFDTFSNRNRPRPETLVYDSLPEPLREHCLRIIRQAIGNFTTVLDTMDEILQREDPTPSFVRAPILSLDGRPPRYTERFFEDCIKQGNFYEAMDAIEVGAFFINTELRKGGVPPGLFADPDKALDEANARFVQHGVGYQFSKEQGHFVRVDSTFMHDEVVKPAMTLLMEQGFEGAAQEFDKAQQFYRQMAVDADAGKEAVSNAQKAVESVMKSIMDARHWTYDNGDTFKRLLDKLIEKGLVPPKQQTYFGGLRSALESGLPTIGNSMARHGQGPTVKPIEEHMVTLGMHLAAATIRFLVEAHKAME